jgi:C4-dicarboxylate-specific signal transduction histidine kinase
LIGTATLAVATINAYSVADRILIAVEDECGGLPERKVEEIFRPFAQLGVERTGLGLGLPISRRGVEANGGRLHVRLMKRTGGGLIGPTSTAAHPGPLLALLPWRRP